MSFNIFDAPSLRDVKVGYISTDRGYVSGVGLWDANVYAKRNPGTTFVFQTREKTQYLNINEVNELTPNDLQSNAEDCKGIQMDKKSEDAPVQVIFMGGGGIGAKANPIIGRDGALIGIDMVSRGFGYQYPPTVEVRDESGIAAGAVVTVGIGTTATVYQSYDDEEDFEEYFPPHILALAPAIIPNDILAILPSDTQGVGFGDVFSPDGKNLGSWNPNRYVNPSATPFQETVEGYIKTLREVQNPWWTTRDEPPLRVSGNGKTTRTFYKVTSPFPNDYWGKKDGFMNTYAISPVPPSNAKGSDFAGKWYTFEWDLDVPFDGEYIIRWAKDNKGKVYIDNQPMDLLTNTGGKGSEGPRGRQGVGNKVNLTKGMHSLRLELFNIPIREKFKVQEGGGPQQELITKTQVAGVDFIKKSNGYYMTVGGNVETEVTLKLTYNDSPRIAGTAITKIIIPNPDGNDLVLEREKIGDTFVRKGSVSAKSIFKRSELGYGPIQLSGNDGSSKLVRKNKAYGATGKKYAQINFFDTHGTDVNAHLNSIGSVNLQDYREVKGKITGLKSTETQEVATVFNTIDWITKANRKLWRTNVYARGGFLNDYGVCPFNTAITLKDNPYAGTHVIKWSNVNFPITGNYVIEIAVDDNVNLKIGDQVSIRKEGFTNKLPSGWPDNSTPGNHSTGKYRQVHPIKKGNYTITAELEQIPGGKFGFDTTKGINPMALAINIETVFSEKERVVQKSWNVNPMGIAMVIEAPAPPIPQAPIPKQEGRCPPNPFWTTRFPAKVQWHPVVHKAWGEFQNKYAMSPVPPYDTPNTSQGSQGGSTNSKTLRGMIKDWYKQRWNRIASEKEIEDWIGTGKSATDIRDGILGHQADIAGVLNIGGVSGRSRGRSSGSAGGVSAGGLWTNEWTVDIPYEGYYKLKGTVDDEAKFWIGGKMVLDLTQKRKDDGGFKGSGAESKVFLSEGPTTIKVEVHNYKFEETKLIDQKIFSTNDWVGKVGLPPRKKNVQFKITTGSMYSNGIEIPELGINFSKEFTNVFDEQGRHVRQKGQLKESLVKEVEINKVYTVKVTSKETTHGVRLRAKGSVLQAEEHIDMDWTDVQCAVSEGRFYDFKNGPNEATCKFIVTKPPQVSSTGSLAGGTVKDGVTYEGPRLADYTSSSLGRSFSPFHTDPAEIMGKSWTMKWKNVNFPESGTYTLKCLADDTITVRLDGRQIGFAKVFEDIRTYNFEVSAGKHTLEMVLTNIPAPATHTWRKNPVYASAIITRKVRVGTGVLKSWAINPVGVSAKLIPPPCPKTVGGKGILDPVRPVVPGNGYRPPTGPGYPVGLRLKEVIVKKPGINYNCAVDEVVIEPNEGGAKLSLCDCGPFGTINKVCVDDPGLGFTRWPDIRIISDTGVNADLVPVFEAVRDPVKVSLDKLIQVTDLVGIKQTGYYEGRAYFGAIFYKEGVKYAGYYETAGELVQIYDTLQESIDAMVTTPPSAILRQGTDIQSDDPRLDIPGTPDNLV